MRSLDISDVAKQSGIPASALRYYEERGLIAAIGRRGLRRVFDAGVVRRLAFISLGQAAGFSLDEIARMIGPEGGTRIDRDYLAAKADDLDRTIRRLSALREGLRHAADCPAPSHMECPTFRRLMKVASSRRRTRPKRQSCDSVDLGGGIPLPNPYEPGSSSPV